MLGPKQVAQEALFYEFSLEGHVPEDHLLRRIDALMDFSDDRLSRSEFTYDAANDRYTCPAGKLLQQYWTASRAAKATPPKDDLYRYHARRQDCSACPLKPRCCPETPTKKLLRSIHEEARDVARAVAATPEYAVSRCERKKVEMAFAHLKRILKLDRLRLRGPAEFLLAATAQNLRKMAKLLPA